MNELDFQMLSVLNKTHNITKAAELLFLTQPALSKRITALEEELGTVLITRTRQGIHFTPDGEAVLQYAEKAAHELYLMRERLLAGKGILSGTLNVGVTNNYALFSTTNIIMKFHQAYPQVTVNLITDHSRKIFNRIDSGELDVGFVRGEYSWDQQKLLLHSERICAIRNRSDEAKTFHELPYIGRLSSPQLMRSISKWLNENNLPQISCNIYTENIVTCVQMVELGLGWAIVPELVLKDFSGIVTPLSFQNGTPLSHNTYLMYSRQNLTLPALEAFVETVRSLFPHAVDCSRGAENFHPEP